MMTLLSSETKAQELFSLRAKNLKTLRLRYARKGLAPRIFQPVDGLISRYEQAGFNVATDKIHRI
jgi:hypothetical protein